MQIIEVNHKTISNLLKKKVQEFWLKDDRDAYIKFTDGSVVCIHVLNYKWETYVALNAREEFKSGLSFSDSQDVNLWYTTQGVECLFTSRTLSIDFDTVRYYISDKLQYPTRQYLPVVEFHYYEKGETWE